MDYQGNDRLGPRRQCLCGYWDFKKWGTSCENCGKPKKPDPAQWDKDFDDPDAWAITNV